MTNPHYSVGLAQLGFLISQDPCTDFIHSTNSTYV